MARWASVPCRCLLNRWARPFPTTVAQDWLAADRVLDPVVHRNLTRSMHYPQIYCRPTHSMPHPQPDCMTSSKKSARRNPARRRRQQAQPRLKVRRPDELLAIIPYLVGFHPDESIVAVFIKSVEFLDCPDGYSSGVGWRRACRADRLAGQALRLRLSPGRVQCGFFAGSPADSAHGSFGRTQADRCALRRARSVVVTQLWG